MANVVYTKEMLVFLKKTYKKLRGRQLTAAFNAEFGTDKKYSTIRATMTRYRLYSGRPKGSSKGENIRLFTPDQVQFIRDQYKKQPIKDVLEAVNTTYGLQIRLQQLKTFVKNQNILSGRTGCFPKGNVPHNTGTVGLMKKNSGSFIAGQRPPNWQPIGHERICSKDGYVYIKVAERSPYRSQSTSGWYRHKHVVLWETHNGPVPEGHVIRFIDGDNTHIDIDNFMLVSKGENARLNKIYFNEQPKEVKPALLAIVKLEQAVLEKSRNATCK